MIEIKPYGRHDKVLFIDGRVLPYQCPGHDPEIKENHIEVTVFSGDEMVYSGNEEIKHNELKSTPYQVREKKVIQPHIERKCPEIGIMYFDKSKLI